MITSLAERNAWRRLGFDPDTLVDPSLEEPKAPVEAPITSNPLAAGLRSMAANVLPNAAGIGVGTLGSSIATPAVGIPLGIAASAATKYIQDAILENTGIGKQLKADEAQHPGYTLAGGLINPFFKPDIKGLINAGKGVVTQEITPEVANTLKHIALNAGIQSAGGYATKALETQTLLPDIDKRDVLGLVAGTLMSSPTKYGKSLIGGLENLDTPKASPKLPVAPVAPVEPTVKIPGLDLSQVQQALPATPDIEQPPIVKLPENLPSSVPPIAPSAKLGPAISIPGVVPSPIVAPKVAPPDTIPIGIPGVIPPAISELPKTSPEIPQVKLPENLPVASKLSAPDLNAIQLSNSLKGEQGLPVEPSIQEPLASQVKGPTINDILDAAAIKGGKKDIIAPLAGVRLAQPEVQTVSAKEVPKVSIKDILAEVPVANVPKEVPVIPKTEVPLQPESSIGKSATSLTDAEIALRNKALRAQLPKERLPDDFNDFLANLQSLGENPVKIRYSAKDKRLLENALNQNPTGIEAWADGVIKDRAKRTNILTPDPQLYAAGIVKGSILAKKGINKFNEWAKPMIDEFGVNISPHLHDIYSKSIEAANNTQSNVDLHGNLLNNDIDLSHTPSVIKASELPGNTSISESPHSPGRRLWTEISKIMDWAGTNPDRVSIGQGMNNYYEDKSTLSGRYGTHNLRRMAELGPTSAITRPGEFLSQDSQQLRNVRDWFAANKDRVAPPTLSPHEESLRDEIIRVNRLAHDDAVNAGITQRQFNPNEREDVMSRSAREALFQNIGSNESQNLQNDYLDYKTRVRGQHIDDARQDLSNILSYTPHQSNPTASYMPLDHPGSRAYGDIPPSWREQNLLQSQARHSDRMARRIAYEQNISPIQDTVNQHMNNDSVNTVMRNIAGDIPYKGDTANDIMQLLGSGTLGPETALGDIGTSPTMGMQHHDNPYQALKNYIQGSFDLRRGIRDAQDTGRIKEHMNTMEFGNGIDELSMGIKRISSIVNQTGLKNVGDKISRGLMMSQGKLTTSDFLQQVRDGRLTRQGQKWFSDFGRDVPWRTGNLTDEQIRNVSARYVDATQGTYDYRGLPKEVMEGNAAPYLQLARWSIEKSNNFKKYTIDPARDGNYTPLLNSLFGMFAGGVITTKLKEALTGRKSNVPDLKEIWNSPDGDKMMPYVYKLAALSSAGSNMGIIGNLFKSALDYTYGKNKPQVYNNIGVEFLGDAASLTASYADKLSKDGLRPDDLVQYTQKLLQTYSQMYRTMYGIFSADKQSDIDKANQQRDLRVYNTLSGNKIEDHTSPFQLQLGDPLLEQFQRETDTNKIVPQAQELVQRALTRSEGKPEKLLEELSAIKSSHNEIMPNPATETGPKHFQDFVAYLEKTKGKAETDKLRSKYGQTWLLNSMKNDLVPQ